MVYYLNAGINSREQRNEGDSKVGGSGSVSNKVSTEHGKRERRHISG